MSLGLDYVWYLTLRDSDTMEHLMTLYSLAVMSKAKTILEIGSGQSTFALTAAANENKGQFYSIELTPQESNLRLFPEGEGVLEKEPRYHSIEGSSVEGRSVEGRSIEVQWDKPVDFFFLDSGHTYDLTLAELKKYTPFVKSGGFICMHDTGEYHNEAFQDCRRAMIDFLTEVGWEFRTMNCQSGFTIIRKP